MVACKINLDGDIISDIAISIGSCSAVARRLGETRKHFNWERT